MHGVHLHHLWIYSEHVVDLLGAGPALRESPREGLGLRPGRPGRQAARVLRVEPRGAARAALDRVRPQHRRPPFAGAGPSCAARPPDGGQDVQQAGARLLFGRRCLALYLILLLHYGDRPVARGALRLFRGPRPFLGS